MPRMSFVGAVAAVVLASSACNREPKGAAPAVIPSLADASTALAELPLSPTDRRNALATIYRPAPDRRLLRGLDEIEHVITGKAPARGATARYDAGKWIVTIGDREVARFSEIPTFDEALAVATSRAQELVKSWKVGGPVPPEDTKLPFDDEAFAVLTAAQETWAKAPTRTALHDAAAALTAMALMGSDGMDLSDDVPARALAVVAIDKALSAPTRTLEAVLALALGYRTSAEKLSEPLPPGDPNRQYLHDVTALGNAARAHGAPSWTRYLWSRRLRIKGERAEEASFRRAAFPDGDLRLPIVALRSAHAEFAEGRDVAALYPAAVLLETASAARTEDGLSAAKSLRDKPLSDPQTTAKTIRTLLTTASGKTLVRFDRDLPKVGSSDKGPFLDADLHRSYLRAFMYTAELGQVVFDLDSYGSPPAAKEFLDDLEPSSSVESKELKAWGLTMVAIAQGADPIAAIPRIRAASPFGFGPRLRLTRVIQRRTNHGDAAAQKAARELGPFFDTRPYALDALADVAWNSLLDVRLGEKYWREVGTAASHYTNARRWWAQRSKDESAIRALWADEAFGASDRIAALGALEKMGHISASEADAEIDRFVARNDDWPARESAAAHLIWRGRYEHARTIAKDWLSRHERSPGLEAKSARVLIAESFEKESRWAEALEAVKPAVDTWAFDAMNHAAVAHARLGHRSESYDLASKMLERYPDASSVHAGANVRWLSRDYDGAAELLAHPPREARARNKDWQYLGDAFATSFAKAPADATKAIDALLAKGIAVENVMQMAWNAWQKNEAELAFLLISRPPPPKDRAHHIGRLVNGYTMMRTWKGEQAATDWIRPQVKPEESLTLASMAMRLGEEPLIWSVASESGSPGDIEQLWTLRAASARRTKSLRSKLDEVRAHYERTPGGGGYWNVIGRYLAGLADDATVVALARDPRSSAEVAFYMGARAEGEARYEDANDFYRCALESDVGDSKEVAQARATLTRWKGSGPLAKAGEIAFPALPAIPELKP